MRLRARERFIRIGALIKHAAFTAHESVFGRLNLMSLRSTHSRVDTPEPQVVRVYVCVHDCIMYTAYLAVYRCLSRKGITAAGIRVQRLC